MREPKPVGDSIRYWYRQKYRGGRPSYPAPVYVFDTYLRQGNWYTENGQWSCLSGIEPATVVAQGGVELTTCPWDTVLPEGF